MNTKIFFSLVLLFWHISATGFFGWNFTAQSAEEIIVDGMFVIGMAMLWGKSS